MSEVNPRAHETRSRERTHTHLHGENIPMSKIRSITVRWYFIDWVISVSYTLPKAFWGMPFTRIPVFFDDAGEEMAREVSSEAV